MEYFIGMVQFFCIAVILLLWCRIQFNNTTLTLTDLHSLQRSKKESSDKVYLSANATAFDPSRPSSRGHDKTLSSNELLEGAVPSKAQGVTVSLPRPSSSASSASDRGGATSTSAGRGLSPSSSVGSLTSEKSTLNPHAKVGSLIECWLCVAILSPSLFSNL